MLAAPNPMNRYGMARRRPGATQDPLIPNAQPQQPNQTSALALQRPQAPNAALTAPKPLTAAGGIAEQQTTQQLQTGAIPAVQSAQNATTRANALRYSQALQRTRGDAARGNLSLEAAQRAQEESIASANAENLNAQNQVNQLQRGMSSDLLNRADAYENRAVGRATDERDFGYGKFRDEMGDYRADQSFGYQKERDAIGDKRYDQNYADTRGDVAYNRGYQEKRDTIGDARYDQTYKDSREDLGYNRNYQRERDTIGDKRYDTSYADSRSDINYERDYRTSRDSIGDSRYDQSYKDSRGDIQYGREYQERRDTVGDSRLDRAEARDDSRYQDSRGDINYERTYRAGRDQVGDSRYADETAYSRGRDTVNDTRYTDETAYNRGKDSYEALYRAGRDAVNDNRYNTTYKDSRSDSLINSVTDPRAAAYLRSIQASGGNVQVAYDQMMDKGQIKDPYRSATPGESAYQARVDELQSYYPDKSDAEIQALARSERETERDIVRKPLDATVKATERQEADERILKGQGTPEDWAKLPPVSQAKVPKGLDVSSWLQENSPNVNIGGKGYTVIGGYRTSHEGKGGTRHTDFVEMKDQDGKTVWMARTGELFDTKPTRHTTGTTAIGRLQ